jgi:hypothetical protein
MAARKTHQKPSKYMVYDIVFLTFMRILDEFMAILKF